MKKKTWKSFAGVGGFLLIGGVSVSYIANANDVAILDFESLKNAVMKKVEGKKSSTEILNASNTATKGTAFSLEDLTALRAPLAVDAQKNNIQNVSHVEPTKSIQVTDQTGSTYNGMTNLSTGSHPSNQVVSQNQQSNPSHSSPSVNPSRSPLPGLASAPPQPVTKPINDLKIVPDFNEKKPTSDVKPREVISPTTQVPKDLTNETPGTSGNNQNCVEEKSNQADANKSNSTICTTQDKQPEGQIVNNGNPTSTSLDLPNENVFGNSSQPTLITDPKVVLTDSQSNGSLDLGVKSDVEKSANLDALIGCDTDLSKCGLIAPDAENPLTSLLPVNFENDLSVTGVPLPSSLWLASLGAACFFMRRRQPLPTLNG